MNTARTSVLALSVLGLILAAGLTGCAAHGEHTSRQIKAAEERQAMVKTGLSWQQAHQHFMAGNLDKALTTIDQAIELNADVARSHALRGRILMEMGRLEQARDALLTAQRLDDKHLDAHYYLGVVYERFSQPERALACYKAAAALDQANPQYVVAAGEMLIAMQRLDEAQSWLDASKDRFTHNAGVRQLLGQIAGLRGDKAQAAQYLYEARLLAPDDLPLLEELVRAQMAAGKTSDADFHLSALLRNAGYADRSDLKALRASLYMRMSRFAEARSLLSTLTADGEPGANDAALWVMLAESCVKTQDWGRLRIAANRAIALAPQRSEGYLLRALGQRQAGQLAQALATLEDGLARSRADVRMKQLQAVVLLEMGRESDAREVLATIPPEQPAQPQQPQPATAGVQP